MKIQISLWMFFMVYSFALFAQDNSTLLDLAQSQQTEETKYTVSTFKSVRVVNGHSTELRHQYELDFLISHRFGPVSDGSYQMFGLDQANIRIAMEYGLTDWLEVGLGRSSYEKTYDMFAKSRLFRQCTGKNIFPVNVSYLLAITYKTLKVPDGSPDLASGDRMTFTNQLLFSRKFSDLFSFQLSPTWVHHNYVPTTEDPNDIMALGAACRVKITRSVHFNIEYYHQFNPFESVSTYDPVGVGIDIETGGHVFQLHLTNARVINEKGFITETQDDFFDGNIRFGFNIFRTFQLKAQDEKGW